MACSSALITPRKGGSCPSKLGIIKIHAREPLNTLKGERATADAVLTDTVGIGKSKYVFSFEGREYESKTVECESLDEARNEAVRYLGAYLSRHPGFANEGHWRVNVENDRHQHLLHVIVATVTSRFTKDSDAMNDTFGKGD
jgi:hypothetical protein